jgi:deoxycytidine triphosphate deaminase
MTLDLMPIRKREDRHVPNLVTGDRLREAVRDGTFIERGDVQSVEGVKYDFHMGSRILKASFTQAIDMANLTETERSQIGVEPGEVVFVMTKERLRLPSNMIATLSPKRTLAHSGIIVLGGFAIDPNYSGVLWMGLYNFSSTRFPLRAGRKLIAAMFYELYEGERQDFPIPVAIAEDDDFPGELVNLIKNYKPIELKGLQDEIEETKRQIIAVRSEIATDKNWKDDFKTALDAHNIQIEKILTGLEAEKGVRAEADKRIESKLDGLTSLFGGGKAIAAIVLVILTVLLTLGGERLFSK